MIVLDTNVISELTRKRSAEAYGRIAAEREAIGRPISQADAQIAAICDATGSRLATRNVDDFEGLGIEIVNPWP